MKFTKEELKQELEQSIKACVAEAQWCPKVFISALLDRASEPLLAAQQSSRLSLGRQALTAATTAQDVQTHKPMSRSECYLFVLFYHKCQ